MLLLLDSTGSVKEDLSLCSSGKRPPTKAKKSPVGNWLSFFHLGKSQSVSKRKLKRHPSEPNEIKSIALPGKITAAVTQLENKKQLSELLCPSQHAFVNLNISLTELDSLVCVGKISIFEDF